MKLNIYQLCTKDLNVGSIRVVLNNSLREKVRQIVSDLRFKKKSKEISTALGIDYTTLWDYCNRRNSIPLIILKKLETISGKEFNQSKFRFVCGHQKISVKLPTEMDETLAKIVGAIIADGHLKIRESKRGHHYELVLREEYYSNVKAFSQWLNKAFGIQLEPKKEDNHYSIYLSNKIIVLYLTSVLNLPSGRKVDIVSIPEIFKRSQIFRTTRNFHV
tara:strand:- start:1689 stop:2342 length:654 start_codon:yes stop_codon:yes gene_type:complete